jgi:hypothetical protein
MDGPEKYPGQKFSKPWLSLGEIMAAFGFRVLKRRC